MKGSGGGCAEKEAQRLTLNTYRRLFSYGSTGQTRCTGRVCSDREGVLYGKEVQEVGQGHGGILKGIQEREYSKVLHGRDNRKGSTMNWRTFLKEYQKWEFRKESYVVGGGGQVEQKNVGNGREYRVGSTE